MLLAVDKPLPQLIAVSAQPAHGQRGAWKLLDIDTMGGVHNPGYDDTSRGAAKVSAEPAGWIME